jgi:hypothetical protein
MNIIIGDTPVAGTNPDSGESTIPVLKKRHSREKRKNREDRRKSIRDGVVVTLSTKKDRRKQGGRRKADRILC